MIPEYNDYRFNLASALRRTCTMHPIQWPSHTMVSRLCYWNKWRSWIKILFGIQFFWDTMAYCVFQLTTWSSTNWTASLKNFANYQSKYHRRTAQINEKCLKMLEISFCTNWDALWELWKHKARPKEWLKGLGYFWTHFKKKSKL